MTRIKTYLCHEHCPWWNLHIMSKFEVLQKAQCLNHADVAIHLKAHIRSSYLKKLLNLVAYCLALYVGGRNNLISIYIHSNSMVVDENNPSPL